MEWKLGCMYAWELLVGSFLMKLMLVVNIAAWGADLWFGNWQLALICMAVYPGVGIATCVYSVTRDRKMYEDSLHNKSGPANVDSLGENE